MSSHTEADEDEVEEVEFVSVSCWFIYTGYVPPIMQLVAADWFMDFEMKFTNCAKHWAW